ncbi:hypothetical protein BH20ACT5_BH20ACT5_17840 [soil metagenome]
MARFATLVDELRAESQLRPPFDPDGPRRSGELMLSSGDNFLAGPEFRARLDKGVPYCDSIAMRLIGYDASAIGNHEFDFGPDVLAAFIAGFGGETPFVSANLDVSAEPSLARLEEMDILVARTIVRTQGDRVGIVGATTPELASISSPRDVEVFDDVQGLVQRQVDALTRLKVNKIILVSHLQDINEERALVTGLCDVDVVIAGGGSELLANEEDLLVPGDERSIDPNTGLPERTDHRRAVPGGWGGPDRRELRPPQATLPR